MVIAKEYFIVAFSWKCDSSFQGCRISVFKKLSNLLGIGKPSQTQWIDWKIHGCQAVKAAFRQFLKNWHLWRYKDFIQQVGM